MKITTLLFAFYIVFLAVLPCNERDICMDDEKVEGMISTSDQEHHNESETDLCSPFCTCACCASHMKVIPSFETLTENIFHHTTLVTPYTEKPLVNNTHSIWQPPRLV